MATARRSPGRAVAAAALLLAACASGAAVGPARAASELPRVASIYACTDQLLVQLADRAQIVSVSHLAVDPSFSVVAEQAEGLRLNHGQVEEILPRDPDLVLAGAYSAPATVSLLRRLGVRVLELPVAHTLDDIRANIRTVAEAIGRPAEGERLIAHFDAALPPAADPGRNDAPVAALYWANSYSSGRNTLAAAILRRAGLRNLGTRLGLSGNGALPLEVLLRHDPDLLVTGRRREGQALAETVLRHPALDRAFAAARQVTLPGKLWVCGTPATARAVQRLHAAAERLRNDRARHSALAAGGQR